MAKPLIPSAAAPSVPVAPAATESKAKLSKADKQALFAVPRSIDAEIAALEASIVECNDRKSASIKAIEDALGNGPFGVQGEVVRISSRTLKNEDGTPGRSVFFFKGQGKIEIDRID